MSTPQGFLDLPFTKMHGLGNDFVVMEAQHIPPSADRARLAAWVSHRHFGIGSDGLIVIAPPSDPSAFDIQFIFYNSDGSRAEMCGNGIRCFAQYVVDQGIMGDNTFRVETLAGLIQPRVNPNGTVTVDMGTPILTPAQIPFQSTQTAPALPIQNELIELLGRTIPVTPVSMGNPHCIIFQQDLASPLDPAIYGPAMEVHPCWPAKTNVEFVDVVNRTTLNLVVWERGCGFTLACGTGACATAVAAILHGKTENRVTVNLPGGPLFIEWDGTPTGHVMMQGPAQKVFEGTVHIPQASVADGLPLGSATV